MNTLTRALLLVLLATGSAWLVRQVIAGVKPRGTLVLCGGGLEFSGNHVEAAKALGELAAQRTAGGRDTVMASIHSGAGSSRAASAAWVGEPNDPGYKDLFLSLGFKPFFVPLAIDNYEATAADRKWADKVAAADVVFLNGGDQIRHTRALLKDDGSDSTVLASIRQVLDKDGIVIGTSAGTHAQSAVMFGGGVSPGYLESNSVRHMSLAEELGPVIFGNPDPSTGDRAVLSPTLDVPGDTDGNLGSYGVGLGFLSGVLLDSHSGARGRLGRMLVAMAVAKRDGTSPLNVGFGVDENTCLIWDRATATGTVRGQHGLWALDIGSADLAGKDESPFRASGVRLSYFADGDVLALDDGNPRQAVRLVKSARTPVSLSDGPDSVFSSDIFGKDALHTAIRQLITTRAAHLRATSGQEGHKKFAVGLNRSATTRAYEGSDGSFGIEQLDLSLQHAP